MKPPAFTRTLLLGTVAAGLAGAMACSQTSNTPTSPSNAELSGDLSQTTARKAITQSTRLNLSHVECVEGQVEVHFVLLFVPEGVTPGLTVSFSSPAGTAARGKHAGNVWHYTGYLPSGSQVNITTATVQVNGQTVSLANPGEYAGTYNCGEPSEPCGFVPQVSNPNLVCLEQPLGNPASECTYFAPGSTALGKDDNLSGSSENTTRAAAIAIVKDGVAGCAPGQTAYRLYTNVGSGNTLLPPSGGTSISHITYCSCPSAQ